MVTLAASPNWYPLPPAIAKSYVKDIKISVYPTATSAPTIGGQPLVSKNISVKLLKLNANAPISNGDIATNNSGNVILQNDCLGVAPSTFAASKS